MGKFENLICSHSSNTCAALFGGKLRATGLLSKFLSWPSQAEELLASQSLLFKDEIAQIESKPIDGCIFPLREKQNRIYDRVVLYWEDRDSSAVLELFLKEMGLSSTSEKGFCTSLSRWGGLKTFDWLKSFDLTESQIRGLLVLSPELLDSKGVSALERACERVLLLQTGGE